MWWSSVIAAPTANKRPRRHTSSCNGKKKEAPMGFLLRMLLILAAFNVLLRVVRMLAGGGSRRASLRGGAQRARVRAPESKSAKPRRPPAGDIVDAEFEDLSDARRSS